MLTVEKAEPADQAAVVDLLSQAASWLAGRGIHQWPVPFPADRVATKIAEGHVFVARNGSTVVGTITLDFWADPEFWQEADDGDAGYVHRLAVRRDWAGQGVGALLLDWAADQVARSGRRWLRLDCMKDNHSLHNYYRRLGFEHLRDVNLAHRISGSLFQKPATILPKCRRSAHPSLGRTSAGQVTAPGGSRT